MATIHPQTKLTKRNAERLMKLAGFLRNLPDAAFDFASVVHGQHTAILNGVQRAVNCEATACALGWMPNVFPRACTLAFDSDADSDDDWAVEMVFRKPFSYAKNGKGRQSYQTAQAFFGITRDESNYLFSPVEHGDGERIGHQLSSSASAKQVADHIQRFVQVSRAMSDSDARKWQKWKQNNV